MKMNFNSWKILYDPYTDFLQVSSPVLFKTKKEDTVLRQKDNFKVLLDKKMLIPLLIEINFAETIFKTNLENLTKKEIFDFLSNNLKGNYE